MSKKISFRNDHRLGRHHLWGLLDIIRDRPQILSYCEF